MLAACIAAIGVVYCLGCIRHRRGLWLGLPTWRELLLAILVCAPTTLLLGVRMRAPGVFYRPSLGVSLLLCVGLGCVTGWLLVRAIRKAAPAPPTSYLAIVSCAALFWALGYLFAPHWHYGDKQYEIVAGHLRQYVMGQHMHHRTRGAYATKLEPLQGYGLSQYIIDAVSPGKPFLGFRFSLALHERAEDARSSGMPVLCAYPDKYGVTAMMTLVVAKDGGVYWKNTRGLCPKGYPSLAGDDGWELVK